MICEGPVLSIMSPAIVVQGLPSTTHKTIFEACVGYKQFVGVVAYDEGFTSEVLDDAVENKDDILRQEVFWMTADKSALSATDRSVSPDTTASTKACSNF